MKKYIVLAIATAILATGCAKENFENIRQSGRLSGEQAAEIVEADPDFLSSYVSGLYSWLVQYKQVGSTSTSSAHDDFGLASIYFITDSMGQDIVYADQHWGQYDYLHDFFKQDERRAFQIWTCFYTLIANANEIINFFGEDDPTNPTLRSYLGQAYALRALAYHWLILCYQDIAAADGSVNKTAPAVPIVYASRDGVSTDDATKAQGRNTIADLMTEIERNLNLALPLLKGAPRASKNEVDFNTCQGIAARYYLMTQQWDKAAAAADSARAGHTIMDAARLLGGFYDVEDDDVLWGFNHTTETCTIYASFFSQMSNDSQGYAGLDYCAKLIDKSLYDQIPVSDYRKAQFNGPDGDATAATAGAKNPYAARKFGYLAQWLQDYLFMRASEMYLIEAEAKLRGGDQAGADAVMTEFIAKRDPVDAHTTWTLDDILLQRRIELWGEGSSYFDIRRNGQGVDRTYPGTNHKVWGQKVFAAHTGLWVFQIPLSEIQNNAQISEADQNPIGEEEEEEEEEEE